MIRAGTERDAAKRTSIFTRYNGAWECPGVECFGGGILPQWSRAILLNIQWVEHPHAVRGVDSQRPSNRGTAKPGASRGPGPASCHRGNSAGNLKLADGFATCLCKH